MRSRRRHLHRSRLRKCSTNKMLGYEVGDSVIHKKFGVGTVKAIREGGRDFEVTVDFPSWGVKKMFAEFAKLEKVEE